MTVVKQNLLLHVQLHNSTAYLLKKILYKLYSLQLNCTYSNYTEAAATCSAAQQHSTFTEQILYKMYILQRTVLTVIRQKLLLDVQLVNRRETAKLISSELKCSRLFEFI